MKDEIATHLKALKEITLKSGCPEGIKNLFTKKFNSTVSSRSELDWVCRILELHFLCEQLNNKDTVRISGLTLKVLAFYVIEGGYDKRIRTEAQRFLGIADEKKLNSINKNIRISGHMLGKDMFAGEAELHPDLITIRKLLLESITEKKDFNYAIKMKNPAVNA